MGGGAAPGLWLPPGESAAEAAGQRGAAERPEVVWPPNHPRSIPAAPPSAFPGRSASEGHRDACRALGPHPWRAAAAETSGWEALQILPAERASTLAAAVGEPASVRTQSTPRVRISSVPGAGVACQSRPEHCLRLSASCPSRRGEEAAPHPRQRYLPPASFACDPTVAVGEEEPLWGLPRSDDPCPWERKGTSAAIARWARTGESGRRRLHRQELGSSVLGASRPATVRVAVRGPRRHPDRRRPSHPCNWSPDHRAGGQPDRRGNGRDRARIKRMSRWIGSGQVPHPPGGVFFPTSAPSLPSSSQSPRWPVAVVHCSRLLGPRREWP